MLDTSFFVQKSFSLFNRFNKALSRFYV